MNTGEKFCCDRCGKEIKGTPLRMLPKFTKDLSEYAIKKVAALMKPLEDKDFCEECLAEIVEFALNGNTCDDCVREMMEETALLYESYEKAEDVNCKKVRLADLDWNKELNGMGQYSIAERLKAVRINSGLNQTEFSKIIGVTNAHISRMEKGITIPSTSLIKLICKEFGINEEWLKMGQNSVLDEAVQNSSGLGMTEKEVVRYLTLVDRKLAIHLNSGINWRPEYEEELANIDKELEQLRSLVDAEQAKRFSGENI